MNTLLTGIARLMLIGCGAVAVAYTIGDGSLKWMIRQGKKGNRDRRCHQRIRNWWELKVK